MFEMTLLVLFYRMLLISRNLNKLVSAPSRYQQPLHCIIRYMAQMCEAVEQEFVGETLTKYCCPPLNCVNCNCHCTERG